MITPIPPIHTPHPIKFPPILITANKSKSLINRDSLLESSCLYVMLRQTVHTKDFHNVESVTGPSLNIITTTFITMIITITFIIITILMGESVCGYDMCATAPLVNLRKQPGVEGGPPPKTSSWSKIHKWWLWRLWWGGWRANLCWGFTSGGGKGPKNNLPTFWTMPSVFQWDNFPFFLTDGI